MQLVRGSDRQRLAAARSSFLIRWGLDGPTARSADPALREGTAARALRIVPFLLVALEDPLDDVQAAALATLESFGRQAAWASDAVARFAARTPTAELKRRAAMATWRLSGDRRRPLRLLHELLADADLSVREAAARDVVDICSGLDPRRHGLGPLGVDLIARLDPLLATNDDALRAGVHTAMTRLLR